METFFVRLWCPLTFIKPLEGLAHGSGCLLFLLYNKRKGTERAHTSTKWAKFANMHQLWKNFKGQSFSVSSYFSFLPNSGVIVCFGCCSVWLLFTKRRLFINTIITPGVAGVSTSQTSLLICISTLDTGQLRWFLPFYPVLNKLADVQLFSFCALNLPLWCYKQDLNHCGSSQLVGHL